MGRSLPPHRDSRRRTSACITAISAAASWPSDYLNRTGNPVASQFVGTVYVGGHALPLHGGTIVGAQNPQRIRHIGEGFQYCLSRLGTLSVRSRRWGASPTKAALLAEKRDSPQPVGLSSPIVHQCVQSMINIKNKMSHATFYVRYILSVCACHGRVCCRSVAMERADRRGPAEFRPESVDTDA